MLIGSKNVMEIVKYEEKCNLHRNKTIDGKIYYIMYKKLQISKLILYIANIKYDNRVVTRLCLSINFINTSYNS